MTRPSPLFERLQNAVGAASGADALRIALNERPGKIALVSSFGAESAVLLHMTAEIDRSTPVIFLNTGKLFPETLAYRETLVARLQLSNLIVVVPDPAMVAEVDADGMLWSRHNDQCCLMRKTLPLDEALNGFEGWITGRKRFQGGERAILPVVERDPANGLIKINPLADWSASDVEAYLFRYDLPRHPLVERGYPSIGCRPCTRPVKPGEDPRAGRWSWLDKRECGIHVSHPNQAPKP